jgi:hypothetical protein
MRALCPCGNIRGRPDCEAQLLRDHAVVRCARRVAISDIQGAHTSCEKMGGTINVPPGCFQPI